MKPHQRPNILIFTVDQERFPPVYENEEIRTWRTTYLKTQQLLKQKGFEFKNHYTASTACCPSRTSLYTGQYPSLHNVTQTPGVAKDRFDSDMYWLDANTVPTMGDYFRHAGYQTLYKGKWHISQADIMVPGTSRQSFLSYQSNDGVPIVKDEQIYLAANRLQSFGFSDWVGPEPVGDTPHNSASSAAQGVSGRDIAYRYELVEQIRSLESQYKAANQPQEQQPWLLVASFLNPHDISLFGLYSQASQRFNFDVHPAVPFIPPAPSAYESLSTKPMAQHSYQKLYPLAIQPILDLVHYRRLYYSYQQEVDQEMYHVFQTLKNSIFYDNTIVIFTSDHGDQLGSHGGIFQKFYQAYEESIHIPLIIHSPTLFNGYFSTDQLTSHVDVLPTLLGLAGIDPKPIAEQLKRSHIEVRSFVGRDLSSTIIDKHGESAQNEPIYFMTDDDVTRGPNQRDILGIPYSSVVQPNHIETIITHLDTGLNGQSERWKYSRYYDNPQFWSQPDEEDRRTVFPFPWDKVSCYTTIKRVPVPDQWEMYNLTRDPFEMTNLALSTNPTMQRIRQTLNHLLLSQRKQKHLTPHTH
ncbi:sulfatase-like hydrolase/transferase [Marininema halotolerans]|uniref:Arylsulfatase A n=1 Tax=Marininema halotolerans TaxID=1155944 RepID=A0A1I6P9B4_9BACL|nr:sulfatase-like hydrolase/transferase [Marininema halotolerans]SFS36766.1 Arylsulfatase A [Marininema halotolerans]